MMVSGGCSSCHIEGLLMVVYSVEKPASLADGVPEQGAGSWRRQTREPFCPKLPHEPGTCSPCLHSHAADASGTGFGGPQKKGASPTCPDSGTAKRHYQEHARPRRLARAVTVLVLKIRGFLSDRTVLAKLSFRPD